MVVFQADYIWYTIGSGSFLTCFFSTVNVNLEKRRRGSKYPRITNELYWGTLKKRHIKAAIKELEDIHKELSKLPPSKVVWDDRDLSLRPPWGDDISSDITDLGNYFVTSEGEDFITIFRNALNDALEMGVDLEIRSV